MPSCPICASFVPEGSRYCPSCGNPTNPDVTRAPDIPAVGVHAPTRAASPPLQTRAPSPATGTPSAPAGHSDVYTAGTLLAQRYRIVGLLGKGGMGEVYRADDLTLGQSVALKFLPRALSSDAGRLAGLIDEVRSARQVSHPNVCRVYDVGEAPDPSGAGAPRWFLTMEHVDGEDVATSLRRIGRFPVDKGLEIARQLCAGLAAVHEKGLLHRDLKPANVMLDGRGKVRITDFGLAGEFEARTTTAGQFSGTPAYAAPELFRGEPATAHSDIYALGLVLYEVFTGKRAFDAATLAEVRQQQEHSRPAALSSSAGQIDPAIEEVIFRCLDAVPARRPSSAIAVAAALPGGDPLAAALAAGETPSPAMVAAAGENQGVQPRTALALLAAFFVLLGLCSWLLAVDGFSRQMPLDFPPDVLANKAAEITASFGWTERPVDTATGWFWDTDYTRYVNDHRQGRGRWDPMRRGDEPAAQFVYRRSQRPLVAQDFRGATLNAGRVLPGDPPAVRAGDGQVSLDSKGRLVEFEAVPPQVEERPAVAPSVPDWARVFAAAGLDPSRFTPADPTWLPLAMADARAAWTGTRAGAPDAPLRLEAAAWRGSIVFVRVIGPWTRPERQQAAARAAGQTANDVIAIGLLLLIGLGAALLARHNLRLDRADRRGAARLGAFTAVIAAIGWALQADHVAGTAEVAIVILGTGVALFSGGGVWLLYVALEPFVRRRWPHTVITWNRLLAGRLGDPLVGRDLLIGSVLGVGLAVLFFGALAVGRAVLPSAPEPVTPTFDPLLGARFVAAAFVSLLYNSIMGTLTLFSVIFLILLVCRKVWITALVFIALAAVPTITGTGTPAIMLPFTVLTLGAMIFVLFRFGLVPFAVGNYVLSTLGGGFPVSVDFSQWYAGPSLVVFGVMIAAAVTGFRLSLAGRKVFTAGVE